MPAHLTLALVTLTMAAEVVLPVFVVSTSEARVDLSRVVCTLAGVVVFEFLVIAETLFAALLAFVGPLVLVVVVVVVEDMLLFVLLAVVGEDRCEDVMKAVVLLTLGVDTSKLLSQPLHVLAHLTANW